jgi:hypothetical protein
MNFNRRPKRIAGPGFNINVKFDFKHMADSRNNRNVNNLFPVARSDECYDIKEQELLVTKRENKMVDAHSHVFSSLNGYPNIGGMDENQCRRKILEDLYFIGVALTEYRPDQQGYEQQGSVAQVAGVVTMINESNDIIYPGQTLVMDIQSDPFNRRFTSDKGIPREKRRLVVRPLTDNYRALLRNEELVKRCIVGKAYSHARPDERFEMGINIGHEFPNGLESIPIGVLLRETTRRGPEIQEFIEQNNIQQDIQGEDDVAEYGPRGIIDGVERIFNGLRNYFTRRRLRRAPVAAPGAFGQPAQVAAPVEAAGQPAQVAAPVEAAPDIQMESAPKPRTARKKRTNTEKE